MFLSFSSVYCYEFYIFDYVSYYVYCFSALTYYLFINAP